MPRLELSQNELAEVRGRAANVARRLFAEGGGQGLSFRNVATECGFSTGGLYRYFPKGRDELLAAARVECLLVLERMLRSARDQSENTVDALRSLGDAMFAFATEHHSDYELLWVYSEGDWEPFPELLECNDAVWKPLETTLTEGVAAGLFEGEPKKLARSLYAATMGALTIFLSDEDEDDPLLSVDQLRESLLGLLLRGATPLERLIEQERPRSRRKNHNGFKENCG